MANATPPRAAWEDWTTKPIEPASFKSGADMLFGSCLDPRGCFKHYACMAAQEAIGKRDARTRATD